MAYSNNFGFINDLQDTDLIVKNPTGNFDAKFLQIQNLGGPSSELDASNKFYHDSNSIKILQNRGEIAVFDVNQDKVIPFPPGVDNSVIVYDQNNDSGIRSTLSPRLTDLTLSGTLICEFINRPGGAAFLILDSSVFLSKVGNNHAMLFGDATSTDSSFVMLSKQDATIFLKADTDDLGGPDVAFISNSVKNNKVFSSFSLSRTGRKLFISTSDDGTAQNEGMRLEVSGSYNPTSGRPNPSGFTTAIDINKDGNVDIPNKLTVENLISTQTTYSKSPIGSQVQIVGDTTTLTASQIYSGLIIGESLTANALWTMPSAVDIVGIIDNPIDGSFFKFVVLNNDSGGFDVKFQASVGMNILSASGVGGDFSNISPESSVEMHVILTNIIDGFEAVSLFVTGF